jgi:hypothetical protein
MDFAKQYIIQTISSAANNLRLSTEKIEVVALLREAIANSNNVGQQIRQMKKVTEFSTFAIRLNDIYDYLTSSPVDLFRLSDKIKDHSQFLIKDLSSMLDMVNPATFRTALEKISESETITYSTESNNEIRSDLSKRNIQIKPVGNISVRRIKTETDIEKENIIFEDDKPEEENFFQNYETEILKPIKPIDRMLKRLSEGEPGDPDELNSFAQKMTNNGELSAKIGFEIIANMHHVLSKAMMLIKVRELMPGKDVIESMRACLIVIVAVVKGKEVDITSYLNRAEEFGSEIQSIKIKGLI